MYIKNNHIYLSGVTARQIAQEFGTPLFVYEEDIIRRQYRVLFEYIPYRPLIVHYACKANWNVQVMKLLRDEGAHLDACSPGDVRLGLAAGYTPDQILYTGYALSDDELRYLIDKGVRINVDSLSQMARYAQLGGRGKIGIRVNPGIEAGFHAHVTSGVRSSKFGLHPVQFDEARALAEANDLAIAGLHIHLGSDILQFDPFLESLDVLLSFAEQFDALEYVDLGGGLGVPFDPDDEPFDLETYGQRLTERLERWHEENGRRLTLCLEPGEFLVSESGHLLMRVVDVKPPVSLDGEPTPRFAGTDSSYNHVFSAAMYDAYHGILVAGRAEESPSQPVHVCGNLMQSGDVLAKNRMLPPLREGDILVMQNCGTYAMCRATRFNGRPLPAEVMVKEGKSRLIRERESLDDLLAHQVLD
jgi:diaminopimelate decarboxylase